MDGKEKGKGTGKKRREIEEKGKGREEERREEMGRRTGKEKRGGPSPYFVQSPLPTSF